MCIAAFGLARCATPVPTSRLAFLPGAEQEASETREDELLSVEGLEPDFMAHSEEPRVATKVLAPHSTQRSEVRDEEGLRKKTIASSDHEIMAWYYQGQDRLQAGRYDEAIRAFSQFLESVPGHVYADRAQFWIAESYFRNREYALSLVADNRLLAQFPESLLAPRSLLRGALSQVKMGHVRAARAMFIELLRQYPNEPEALAASKKLAEFSHSSRG